MKLNTNILTSITIAATICLCGSLTAQTVTRPAEPVQKKVSIRPSNEVDQKIMTARKLMNARNFFGAAQLLELTLEEKPAHSVAQNLLLRCYEQLKHYPQAEMLVRRLLEQSPNNMQLGTKLAELLALQGSPEEAARAYLEAASTIVPFDENMFANLVSSMVNYGLLEPATALIDSIRVAQSDARLFALQRGTILEKQRAYRGAAREYSAVVDNDTTRTVRTAESRLMSLLEFIDSSAEVENALLELSNQPASLRVVRLLASHYIKVGKFDQAFEFSVRQDSLDSAEGGALMYFIYQCSERKAFDQVVRMAEHIFSVYTNKPFMLEATFRYAEALREVGRYEDAIEVYAGNNQVFARINDRAETGYRIGSIYLNDLHDYPMALLHFDSVVNHYRKGMGFLQANRGIPFCYLRMGQFQKARQHFKSLLTRQRNDDMTEEAEYHLALISLFENAFDSAETGFRKLMIDHPRGYYVNDAMSMVMLITDAKSRPDLLKAFVTAIQFSERFMQDSAKAQLVEVAEAEDKTLADVALYRLATLEISDNDSTAALGSIDSLIAGYPESYYLPHGLKLKADILLTRSDGVEEAKKLYRQLLEEYPNYPFISDVRTRLRELEAEPLIG